MTSSERVRALAQLSVWIVSFAAAAACSNEPTAVAPRNAPRSARPQLSVSASNGEISMISVAVTGKSIRSQLLYDIPLTDGQSDASLAMPAGVGYQLTVRAHNRYGDITHEGTLFLESVQVGPNRPIAVELKPVADGETAKVALDLVGEERLGGEYQIVVESDAREVREGQSVALRAYLLDSYGNRTVVKPQEVHWAVSDPRAGRLVPDPESRGASGSARLLAAKSGYELITMVTIHEYVGIWHGLLLADPYVDVVAGEDYTCGLRSSGSLFCWGVEAGSIPWGRFATTTLPNQCNSTYAPDPCSVRPIAVAPTMLFSAVSLGSTFACGIDAGTQQPFCWGTGMDGELGNNHWSVGAKSFTPVASIVGTSDHFKAITSGAQHTCALRLDGAAFCWGVNNGGQLGVTLSGSSSFSPVPVQIPAIAFNGLAAGEEHTCGTTVTDVKCWGFGSSGQVGNGLTGSSNKVATPTTVIGVPPGVGTVGSGSTANGSCWSATGGLSFCWGDGTYGQLGIGLIGVGMTMASAQSSVSGLFKSISVGRDHACGISVLLGSVFCWGSNQDGELGRPGGDAASPTAIASSLSFTRVSAGGSAYTHGAGGSFTGGQSCGVTTGGDIYCWGQNNAGQLGIGSWGASVSTPTKIVGP